MSHLTNRIQWIDELKGFILLLVCFNHCPMGESFTSALKMTQAFRMTTFFFLSGLLFSARRHPNIRSYVVSKSHSLFMPYLYLSFFFSLIDPRLYNTSLISIDGNIGNDSFARFFGVPETITSSLEYLWLTIVNIVFRMISSMVSMPLWFVATLFFVSVFYYFIHSYSKIIIVIISLFCLFLSWLLYKIGEGWLFHFNTFCLASFFFAIGDLSKPLVQKISSWASRKLFFSILVVSLIYLYAINLNGDFSVATNNLGPSLYSSCSGILLMLMVFILFSRLYFPQSQFVKGILRNISRNALVILAVHYWFIRIYMLFLSRFLDLPAVLVMIVGCYLSIPLFRNKLYWLLGKTKISVRESLSIE